MTATAPITVTGDPDLDALAGVHRWLVTALGSIGENRWELPTPCAGWDLTALVDHVTGGNWFTVRILADDEADRALSATLARFAGGSAGRQRAAESADDLLVAFRRPGVLDRSWDHVAGPLPGRDILKLRVHDLIVHTWDIEQTLDPPAPVPDDLVRWGLQELADEGSSTAGHFALERLPGPDRPGPGAAVYLRTFGRLLEA